MCFVCAHTSVDLLIKCWPFTQRKFHSSDWSNFINWVSRQVFHLWLQRRACERGKKLSGFCYCTGSALCAGPKKRCFFRSITPKSGTSLELSHPRSTNQATWPGALLLTVGSSYLAQREAAGVPSNVKRLQQLELRLLRHGRSVGWSKKHEEDLEVS